MTEEGARGKAGEGGKEEEGQGRIPPAIGVDFAGAKGTVPALQKVQGEVWSAGAREDGTQAASGPPTPASPWLRSGCFG